MRGYVAGDSYQGDRAYERRPLGSVDSKVCQSDLSTDIVDMWAFHPDFPWKVSDLIPIQR